MPGVTNTEVQEWECLREADDAERQPTQALHRATPDATSTEPASVPEPVAA